MMRAMKKPPEVRLSQMVYDSDGSLRPRITWIGVFLLLIPVLVLVSMLVFQSFELDSKLSEGRGKVANVLERIFTKSEEDKKVNFPPVKAPKREVKEKNVTEKRARLRKDATALTLAGDPASVGAWERVLAAGSAAFTDEDRCSYALALCENGDVAKSGRLVSLLLHRLPKDPYVQAVAGRHAFLKGDRQAAERHFRRALKLESGRRDAMRWLEELGTSQPVP